MSLSDTHILKIRNNKKFWQQQKDNPKKNLYIYLNGSTEYQTIGVGKLPKIVGTSCKQIVKYDYKTGEYRYISDLELARTQGYYARKSVSFKNYSISFIRIVGCSIVYHALIYQINELKNEIKNHKPFIGVIGSYGLEGIPINDTGSKYIFSVLTHDKNISQDNISPVMEINCPPKNIYPPFHQYDDIVDILIWKSPCVWSSLSRNSSYKQNKQNKKLYEKDVQKYSNIIQRNAPKFIIIELPSNFNHTNLSKKNKENIYILKKYLNKYNIYKCYSRTANYYNLNQNRRFWILVFKVSAKYS